MQFDKIKNKGQGQIFHNEHLEELTKTHPIVIYSLYLPVIAGMLYYGVSYKNIGALAVAGLFVAGALAWSLVEYVLHRWVFHMIADSERLKRIAYTIHGVHHEYPRDQERLFMPPVPSLVVALILFSLFYAMMGWYVLAFFPGFLFGYLMYGSMHFAIHAFAPPKYLKALWRNHHLHHYKHPDKGFGVSSVLWDHIFGTIPAKDKPETSSAGSL